jgi:hypothetical protein
MEARMNGRVWGPVHATRTYDLWYGDHDVDLVLEPSNRGRHRSWGWGVSSDSYVSTAWPTWWANHQIAQVVDLRDWLLSATTVNAYPDSTHTAPVALTADTDYLLLPYDDPPANKLALNVTAQQRLTGGQRTLTITGTWGYPYQTEVVTTLNAQLEITGAPVLVDIGQISPGQTLLIGAEQITVGLGLDDTINYARAANGTTAAVHTNASDVSVIGYVDDVSQACIEIAKARFRNRDAGLSTILGDPSSLIQLPRPGLEESVILQSLSNTYGGRALAGLRF